MKNPLVVAYGAGVDSTAMLVGLQQRGETPDLILFADTGSERPETYAYLDTINAWLAQVGFPQVTIVKLVKPKTGDTSLEQQLVRLRNLPSPAYGGNHTCSIEWKIKPQQRFMSSWQPAIDAWARGDVVTQLVGYDAGEADGKRADRATKTLAFLANQTKSKRALYANVYPLRTWGWDRDRCKAEIAAAGLPVPPKSACFFCPFTKKEEIAELAVKHPALADRAIEMERLAHEKGLAKIAGLGRRFSWTDLINDLRAEGTQPIAA